MKIPSHLRGLTRWSAAAAGLILGFGFALGTSAAQGGEGAKAEAIAARETVRVRIVRPDQQAARVLRLFEGTACRHPAGAMAAWKRASEGTAALAKLTKAADAAVTFFNPQISRELLMLDGAELILRLEEQGPRWRAVVRHDDEGAIAALGAAIALTDGAAEAALDGATVDRLGKPGSPLLASRRPLTVAASDRDEAQRGLAEGPALAPDAFSQTLDSGLLVRLEPSTLAATATGSLWAKRTLDASEQAGCRSVEAALALQGEELSLTVTGQFPPEAFLNARRLTVDPDWLDWVPQDRAAAAFAVALDPSRDVWDVLFRIADAIEKADPAKAKYAPLRVRVNIWMLPLGINLEAAVYGGLTGVYGWVAPQSDGLPSALAVLTFKTPAKAKRLADDLGGWIPEGSGAKVRCDGQTVIVTLGQGAEEFSALPVEQRRKQSQSLRDLVQKQVGEGKAPQRAALVWPGRLPIGLQEGSPASHALADAPPVVWTGTIGKDTLVDRIAWGGLKTTVLRFLEKLPMNPPADRGESP